jgi:hypothetical protein
MSERGPALPDAMDLVRSRPLVDALERERFVGMHGAAENGKSHFLRFTSASANPETLVIALDLGQAIDEDHFAWLMLRATAAALVSPEEWTALTRGGDTRSPQYEQGYLAVARAFGELGREALGETARKADLAKVVQAIGEISAERHVRLVIDHLEAPLQVPRRAFDVSDLLWTIRSEWQRRSGFQVLLAARPEAVELAAGNDAAFYGDGLWVHLDRPSGSEWQQAIEATRGGVPGYLVGVLQLSEGHVQTTMSMLTDPRCSDSSGIRTVFAELTAAAAPLAARCRQHARSLHRAGGPLLEAIANWLPAYAALPSLNSKEAYRCVTALAAAGLVCRTPDGWTLLNPLVGAALRGGSVRYQVYLNEQLAVSSEVKPEHVNRSSVRVRHSTP